MKLFKKCCALLALLLVCTICLSGCGNSKARELSDDKIQEIQSVLEEGQNNDEEVEEPEIYADKVWDPELTKGKFVIYTIRATNEYQFATGTTHAGDAALVVTPDGKTMLIDLNVPTNGAYIVDALKKLGITELDYLVLSHPHIDHLGGISIVARYIKIHEMLTNGAQYESSADWRNMHKIVEENNIAVRYVYEGDEFMFGEEVKVNIYNPPRDYEHMNGTAAQNNGSILMKMTYKDATFLTGGDLYAAQETEILKKYTEELHVDVAKMNHHGYGTSNIREWVKAVSPKIAYAQMTSVTSDVVIGRYQAQGSVILHTALDGPFAIFTDGSGTWEVQTSKDRWVETFGTNDMKDGYMTVK